MTPKTTKSVGGHRRNSERPKYSKFIQQELPACKPVLTPKRVISIFLLISAVFIAIGVFALSASRNVVEIVDEYQTKCVPSEYRNDVVGFIKSDRDKTCIRPLKIHKHMKPPIYVYYQLDNFHQNHLRYVKSGSDEQLRNPRSENATDTCYPEDKSNNTIIVPCGLIAWSMFNDTYHFTRSNNETLIVDKKGIAWKTDRDRKFGENVYPKNFQKNSLIGGATLDPSKPLNEQEDLMVWMRTAALPSFRKLYGKIEADLKEGDEIVARIKNHYNTYGFDGKKKLVLSTSSWLGGKNDILGIAYLSVGGLCLVLAVGFTLLYLIKPRQLGDPSYLSWNQNINMSLYNLVTI